MNTQTLNIEDLPVTPGTEVAWRGLAIVHHRNSNYYRVVTDVYRDAFTRLKAAVMLGVDGGQVDLVSEIDELDWRVVGGLRLASAVLSETRAN
jgi:hypothetical protein